MGAYRLPGRPDAHRENNKRATEVKLDLKIDVVEYAKQRTL